MPKTTRNRKKLSPTAIDLYSGAGGVTVGLKKAGFRVLAGVEIDENIARTYKANHPEVSLFIKDIRKLKGGKILSELGVKSVDLVVGCPPCQGFSKLTDKWDREDRRNDLVLEMARLVLELKPKICMMENVSGLAKRGKPILNVFIQTLEKNGYEVNWDILELADYGIPQMRKRVVLFAGKGFKISLPNKKFSKSPSLNDKMKPWKTLKEVSNKPTKVISLSGAIKNGGPQKFNWNVYRDMKEITLKRIKYLKPGGSRLDLPKRLRPECHKDLKTGFQNVYGRLDWRNTPPTITSGCTTLAMGRFGHPSENRALTLREAALIQTFPKNYKFDTDFMDLACKMVGNALPCDFAFIATKQINKYLIKNS